MTKQATDPPADLGNLPTIPDTGELQTIDSGGDSDQAVEFMGSKIIAGRYILQDVLGRGGAGSVYKANDIELGRSVALKFLHASDKSQNHRARLLREAQALAQLSHPNVLTVFDVGDHDGHVFLAAEYINGGTLRRWMTEKKHSWREILSLFMLAGRALAAAHERGIVHRDFKPENVLLSHDGRLVVSDFGLARSAFDGSSVEPISLPALLEEKMTVTGLVAGTPAYMAPEQIAGAEPNPATDQFAFCVTLYESIFGIRPYRFEQAAVQPLRIPGKPKLPTWLKTALRRGLELDPAQRFPTMKILLGEIEKRLKRSNRLTYAAVGAVFAASVASVVLFTRSSPKSVCATPIERREQLWSRQSREQLQKAFAARDLASNGSVGNGEWSKDWSGLNRYADDWARAGTQNCMETRFRQEQSETVYVARMACLEQKHAEFSSLVANLADPAVEIATASKAVRDLSSLEQCSASRIAAASQPPSEKRHEVNTLREALAESKSLVSLRKFDEAENIADRVNAQAQTLGFRPLLAEAAYRLGYAKVAREQYAAAKPFFEKALWNAEATNSDALTFDTLIALADLERRSQNLPEAEKIAQRANAWLVRLGEGRSETLQWQKLSATLAFEAGKYGEAARQFAAAAVTTQAISGDLQLLSNVETAAAAAYLRAGDFDAAILWAERSIGDLEKNHASPAELASPLITLGTAYSKQRNFALAEKTFLRAKDSLQNTGKTLRSERFGVLQSLGNLYSEKRDFNLAESSFNEALEVAREIDRAANADPLAVEGVKSAEVHINLGLLWRDLGKDSARAVKEFSRAKELIDKFLPAKHPTRIIVNHNICTTLYLTKQPQKGLSSCRAANDLAAQIVGKAHPLYGQTLAMYGLVLSKTAARAESTAVLQEAEAKLSGSGNSEQLSWVTLRLAQLALESGNRTLAKSKASTAKKLFQTANIPSGQKLAEEVWAKANR